MSTSHTDNPRSRDGLTDESLLVGPVTLRGGCIYDLSGAEGPDAMGCSIRDRQASIHDEVGDDPLSFLEGKRPYFFIKRCLDVILTLMILLAFWWLYLICALAIKIDDPCGPVFFKQERVTKDGRRFMMYKFRTMVVDAEKLLSSLQEMNQKSGPVFKIHDDPRITPVGRYLRKLSLDELPQFFNVLLGDMSIVGPRPALPSEVSQYTPYQRQRLAIKGGLTCYWQTRMNRDAIPFDEWVDLDLLYIRKCGLWTDFKLIIQTVGCVLTAQGS